MIFGDGTRTSYTVRRVVFCFMWEGGGGGRGGGEAWKETVVCSMLCPIKTVIKSAPVSRKSKYNNTWRGGAIYPQRERNNIEAKRGHSPLRTIGDTRKGHILAVSLEVAIRCDKPCRAPVRGCYGMRISPQLPRIAPTLF